MNAVHKRKHQMARTLSQPEFQEGLEPEINDNNNDQYNDTRDAHMSDQTLESTMSTEDTSETVTIEPKRVVFQNNVAVKRSLKKQRTVDPSTLELSVGNLQRDVIIETPHDIPDGTLHGDFSHRYLPHTAAYMNNAFRGTPSPNHDSAIENTSPSSNGSEDPDTYLDHIYRTNPELIPELEQYGITSVSDMSDTLSGTRSSRSKHTYENHSLTHGQPPTVQSFYMDGVAVSEI